MTTAVMNIETLSMTVTSIETLGMIGMHMGGPFTGLMAMLRRQ